MDRPAGKPLDLVALCQAIGVDEIIQADAQNLKEVRAALKQATSHTDKLSVIIFKAPCRLVDRSKKPMPSIEQCRRCGQCMCIGCGQCVQVCPFGCIKEA